MRNIEGRPVQEVCDERVPAYEPGRIKRILGSSALRVVTVLGSAAAILGVGSTIEATTGNEARAEANAVSGFGSMNGAEKAWCRWPSRWSLCSRAQELASEATKAAIVVSEKYNVSVHNGGADAFRHCTWSGSMAQEFGVEAAQGFGDRHEYKAGQPEAERDMDWYNNQRGRDWATQVNDIAARCLQGMLNDELIGMADEPWYK